MGTIVSARDMAPTLMWCRHKNMFAVGRPEVSAPAPTKYPKCFVDNGIDFRLTALTIDNTIAPINTVQNA